MITGKPKNIPQQNNLSTEKIFKARGLRLWWPRLLAGGIGLLLLTASLSKASDMALFIRQIEDYGIISHPVTLTLTAWSLIALESALGVGLLVFYRPKLIFSLTAMLLLIFLGVTGWAWLTGATEECGCYGAWLRHTPAKGAVEDIIFLAMVALAWAGHRHLEVPQTRAKALAVLSACVIGLMLPVAFGFSIPRMSRPESRAVGIELGHLRIHGLDHVDLSHGAYLIILMETDCLHCQEIVPELNTLAEMTDLPAVLALCTNEEWQRMTFVEEFQPLFPIGQISEDVFSRLIADGDLPRIILLLDGHVKQVWDQTVPDRDRIKVITSPSDKIG